MSYKKIIYTLPKPVIILFAILFIIPILSFKINKNKQQLPVYKNPKISIELRIADLIKRMTIEEKAGQLNQMNGGSLTGPGSSKTDRDAKTLMVKQGKVGSFLTVSGVQNTLYFQKVAVQQSRLGIPLLFAMDVIHGYRTIFPIPLAEACSWDLTGIEQNSAVSAKEASAAGIHWTFAPMCDISNDPRWGRVMEGAGEDPFLAGQISGARVKGFQGNFDNQHILACVKHYAGYGAVEAGREYNHVDMSRVTLWNKHLPSYKGAVDAGAATVMNGFNVFEGVPVSANKYLVTDILKNKWKFKGYLISDWASFEEMIAHGYAKDSIDATQKAINAGSMMDMKSEVVLKNLPNLVKNGKVSITLVNNAVSRILYYKFKLGLFDNPYKYCNTQREENDIFTPNNREIAKTAAQKSLVLLQNKNSVLPIKNLDKKIALIGYFADSHADMFDFWTFKGIPEEAVTIKEGLQKIYPNLKYATGYDQDTKSTQKLINEAVETAQQADVLVVNIGWSGKFAGEDRAFADINVPPAQVELLKALHQTGKPIVALISSGRPLILTNILDYCDAILQCWIPGTETGNAVAIVISGGYNPSAKTVISFPYSIGQIPVYYNHFNTSRPGLNNQGGAWESRYRDIPNAPLFPFGFGLSYTNFAYSNLQLIDTLLTTNKPLKLKVTVQNTGNYDGEEIVQLYINKKFSSIIRPVKELKAFKKIALKIGEQKTLEFTLTKKELSYLTAEGIPFLEPGIISIFVGTNSKDVLSKSFNYLGN
ncbi:MAG: beta-glucosidase BglX [Sphingobacteriales bacterium]|nr:MAG: beta-glucosidase BglX [Sphingobacteriales bacterium]